MSQNEYPIHPAAEVLPLLPEPELKKLAKDIRRRGQIHPILLYKGMVLDGRNRLLACRLAAIEPRFAMVDLELDERGIAPLEYVISLNLRRRHLKPGQQAMAAASALQEWVAEGRQISSANLRRGKSNSDRAKVRGRGRSDDHLAKLFGVSARYVRLADELRKVVPHLAAEVMRGDSTLSRAARTMREQKRAARQTQERQLGARYQAKLEVYCKNMQEMRHRLRPTQLILTDPPYSRKDLPLWDELAETADQCLMRGGFLAVMAGLQFLDQAMAKLANPKHGLVYFWTMCISFSGAHGRRQGLGITTCWRPVLVLFKPPFLKPPRQVLDRYSATLPAQLDHPWEQKPETFAPIIENFSVVGDWVLDPFAGSGSVLHACRGLGRNAVGIDSDPAAVSLIEHRLGISRH